MSTVLVHERAYHERANRECARRDSTNRERANHERAHRERANHECAAMKSQMFIIIKNFVLHSFIKIEKRNVNPALNNSIFTVTRNTET